MLKNKKFLVTGAAGFIGACLARRLVEAGIKPHIIIRKQSNVWRLANILDKVCVHYADLNDYCILEQVVKDIKPNVIYHCAAYGGYYTQKDYDEIVKVNIQGMFNLLKACSNISFDLFVNTGSSSEYGIKLHPMKEEDVLCPENIYGASKASATLLLNVFAKMHKLPIITYRLFSPYGYYEDKNRLVPYVVVKCLKGENPELTSGIGVRDFNFIEDVIEAYILALDYKKIIPGEIFNIANGRQYTVQEIVKKIIYLTGGKVEPIWNAAQDRKTEPESWRADISKAKKKLNYCPKHDLDTGLRKTINWFKQNMEHYQ